MEPGPASRSRSSSAQRAGVSVCSRTGKSSIDNTRSALSLRPSRRRFQAASKRSSASRASPMRSSTTLAKPTTYCFHVALEVIAQLLHRARLVARDPAAHTPAARLVLHQVAIAQLISELVTDLDTHHDIREDDRFGKQWHIWLIAPYSVYCKIEL